jgi:hypothetical protein
MQVAAIFPKPIKVICPVQPVLPPLQVSGKSELELRASHANEGRVAIVTNVAVGCRPELLGLE